MPRRTVLFDLTRLLSATGRSAPTGIERVEYAYARWLVDNPAVDTHFVVTMNRRIRLAAESEVGRFLDRQASTWLGGAQGFSAHQALHNVNAFLAGSDAPQAPRYGYLPRDERQRRRTLRNTDPKQRKRLLTAWAREMAAQWVGAPVEPLLRGRARKNPAIYLRASMDRMEHPRPIERLTAHDGVRMVTFCHDTIPLDFPEYVRPAAAAQCAERMRTMARLSDGIIVNSYYSASMLKKYLAPYRPQVRVSHIGADQDLPQVAGRNLPPLVDTPYFLVVSTIEARKNHQLLFQVWRRLVEALGARAPKLVVAGKRGWEAQTPIAMLDRSGSLADHVYEAGAVPDSALDALRRNALAVLMPSFVEGFGMPVTEALAVNTPVIASDIPVFREVAGDAAELIDPMDGPSWARAILDYAEPGSSRRAAAVERARNYRAPTWERHFGEVDAFLDEIGERHPTLAERARKILSQVAFDAQFEPFPRVSH